MINIGYHISVFNKNPLNQHRLPFAFSFLSQPEKEYNPNLFYLSLQVGEIGELSEIFQWKGEVPKGLPDWKEEEKQHLGEELSDVLLYLIRLSDMCGVDLGQAALRKLQLNALKYPVDGSSNEYENVNNNNDTAGAD